MLVSAEGYLPEFEAISLSSGATKEVSLKLKRAREAAAKTPATPWDELKSLGKHYQKQQQIYFAAQRVSPKHLRIARRFRSSNRESCISRSSSLSKNAGVALTKAWRRYTFWPKTPCRARCRQPIVSGA